MGKPTTLGLDLALTTGWAFGSELGPERWGEIDVHDRAGLGPRAHTFDRRLAMLLQELTPRQIWVEKSLGVSGDSVMIARAFLTVVCIQAHRREIPVFDLSPNTLKKLATGNGRAGKIAMRDAALRYLAAHAIRSQELTFDEADALCLLAYSYNDLDGGAI